MHMSLKGIIIGALALAGATVTVADAQAMPVQPLSPAVSAAPLEHVYYYGYGYRRPFVRPLIRPFVRRRVFGYRRPFIRPFVRPFYGYRRPYYGYGYRRF